MQEPISLDDVELEAKEASAEEEFLRLKKHGKLVSAITTTVVHVVIGFVLWCIIVALGPDEIPQIVAVTQTKDDTYQIEKQDFARSVKRKPQPPKSASRVQTINSVATSPVSVPSIEDPVIDPLGIGTDFGRGFGQGKGNGEGGGGTSSFFGGTAKGNRVVFVVDFSGSMIREGGGVRIQMLKKELISSISKLPKGMSF